MSRAKWHLPVIRETKKTSNNELLENTLTARENCIYTEEHAPTHRDFVRLEILEKELKNRLIKIGFLINA